MSAGGWVHAAACRDSDPELFFPAAEDGEVYARQVAEAKAICARCPVRAVCLVEALERLPFGVAGELDADERRRVRAGRARPAAGRTTGARRRGWAAARASERRGGGS